jgi:uncharacterized membrane protein YgcG
MPRAAPVVNDLPPLLPPNASPTLTFTLREYSRQYNALTWALTSQLALFFFLPLVVFFLWIFGMFALVLFPGGVFIFGFFELVLFLMAIYAFFQRPALRRKVAESGIDPDLWQAHVSRDFWKVANPLIKVIGALFASTVALGCIALVSSLIQNKITESREKRIEMSPQNYRTAPYNETGQGFREESFPQSYSEPARPPRVVVPPSAYREQADVNAAANQEALRAQAIARQQQEYMARAARAQARQIQTVTPPAQSDPYILQRQNTNRPRAGGFGGGGGFSGGGDLGGLGSGYRGR